MGFRLSKSLTIFPGVRLNFGKRGLSSLSIGKRGMTLNVGKQGPRATVGIPGTGLSYSTDLDGDGRRKPGALRRVVAIAIFLLVVGGLAWYWLSKA